MLLALDIGNTNVTLGLFRGKGLVRSWRLSTDARRTADEHEAALRALLGPRARAIRTCAIASVVPAVEDAFAIAAARLVHRPPVLIDHASPFGFRIAYDPPSDVGTDRLVNAAAAMERFGAPVIVADFGTAVTLDVLDRHKTYLGGAIAPGLELAAEALSRRTAKLPRVALHRPGDAIGRTTLDSLRSGLVLGAAALVDGLLERMFRELGSRPPVVATGGTAGMVVPHCRHIRETVPELTLEGIRIVGLRMTGRGKA
jgi:type III pantothenate kinase